MTIGTKKTQAYDDMVREAYAALGVDGAKGKRAPKGDPEHQLQAQLVAQVRTWDATKGPLVWRKVGRSRMQVPAGEWAPGPLSLKYPELMDLYAVPNGGGRSKREAGRLKDEGVLANVPDLALDVAVRKGPQGIAYMHEHWHGLRLETKIPGSYPRPGQRDYMQRLVERGYAVAVWRTLDEGMDLLVRYVEGRWEQTKGLLK
jgi:hypothetical protein